MSRFSQNSATWLQPAAISAYSFGEAWENLLHQLRVNGKESAPRGKKVREMLSTKLTVHNALANLLINEVRNINPRFAVAEWLWIYFGDNRLETIQRYNKEIAKFSDDMETLSGAYGPRWVRQFIPLKNKLRDDPDTRQAVMTIWTENPEPSKDIPCTISFQVLLRQNTLHGVVNMRSSDIWLGLPYDFFTFSMLLNCVGVFFPNAQIGSLTFNLGSSHLYEEHDEVSLQALMKLSDSLLSPRLSCLPVKTLHHVMESPELYEPIQDGWLSMYARVLRAPNREAAWEELK